ncbi:MAG: hypothetical protein E7070_06265 [Bacteroidales bacterium]|nr:hypothetical protein [Bacteroidales bacterium]
MKRNSFFGGHVPSFMFPCACIIAGLMALASTGAYASTKSAAEGEVNTPVEALIPMAKEYVANNNIDADSSATINNSEELAKLLSGTLSGSIEELTSEDISKKLAEKDADKIFTTFMTTNNPEQAKNNTDILNAGMNTISDTYKNIQLDLTKADAFMRYLHAPLEQCIDFCEMIKVLIERGDTKTAVSLIHSRKDNLEEVKSYYQEAIDTLENVNTIYKDITGQNYTILLQQKERLENAKQYLEEVVWDEEGINKVQGYLDECAQAQSELEYQLLPQIKNLKENDIALLKMLLQQQAKFAEDGKSSAEEQAASKELLNKLVENASSMTRNYIIKLAEEQYKPENDPTGIKDVNTSAKVDGNVYKTATGIYRLDGQSVTVYDYSGKLLRTEPLDLKIHTGFAQ